MKTVLVAGASRGIGRGIASELSTKGYTVIATGRSIEQSDLPSAVHTWPCDHTDDAQVAEVFERIERVHGPLDVLACCVWGGYEGMVENGEFTWGHPFWQQSRVRWDAMMEAGVRAGFVASQHAARQMIDKGSGLIVHLSHWAAQKHVGNAVYGISKAATDKMVSDMATELSDHGVTCVSIYPGLVRTEAVLAAGVFDLSNSESPEFIGRAVDALVRDPDRERHSGRVLVAATIAEEYGYTDVDGARPTALGLDDA